MYTFYKFFFSFGFIGITEIHQHCRTDHIFSTVSLWQFIGSSIRITDTLLVAEIKRLKTKTILSHKQAYTPRMHAHPHKYVLTCG